MRRRIVYALVLTAIGCSGSVDQTSQQQQKLAAANAKARGAAQGDVCAQHRWYGDGVCDTFCSDTDSDCVPDGDAVVCAQFIEQSDARCGRSDIDACRFQDPDCTSGAGGGSGSTPPSSPVACALVSEVPNGVCARPASDACRFQDPDCNTPSGTEKDVDCDSSKIKCQTFAAVTCPDGQTPSVVNACYGPCVVKSACAPVACPAIALAPDGVCSPPTPGPCPLADPDCAPTGSGGSTGSGGAPGSSGGSTSTGGAPGSSGGGTGTAGGGGAAAYDCDPRGITCQTFAPVVCPDGQVSSVVNHCYGACVPKDQCAPIACAAYIEASDGVCSRPANDPCRGQDPDCAKE